MINVCVLLADGFEEIEALTVVDLLRRAQIFVSTVTINDDYMVCGSHGINVQADDRFEEVDFDEIDVVVLPGGLPGTTNLKEHEGVCEVVKKFAAEGKYIAAICAAPTVFASLGLLEGKKATCYPAMESELEGAAYIKIPVVKDGNIITSRGMGTAMDFGLELIKVLISEEKAIQIAESIVYE